MSPVRARSLLLVIAVSAAACGTDLVLPPPIFHSVVDTVTLAALDGTPVTEPSAYIIERREAVRIDQVLEVDFAANIDTAGQAQLLPSGALGFGSLSGIKIVNTTFDALRVAPGDPYERLNPVPVNVGTVVVVQSRPVVCAFSAFLPLYAKAEVLAVDLGQRTIKLQLLANTNCGYRSLEPGLPSN